MKKYKNRRWINRKKEKEREVMNHLRYLKGKSKNYKNMIQIHEKWQTVNIFFWFYYIYVNQPQIYILKLVTCLELETITRI